MKINLVTSLHLNHAVMSLEHDPGGPLPMQSFVPVGLLSLKAMADQAGLGENIRVTEVNGLINKGPALTPWHPHQILSPHSTGAIPNDDNFYDHLVDTILEGDDTLVGLMTDADSLHHTMILAERIKRREPQTLVCLGGPASSPLSRSILETFPFVDLVVRGEGELTFVELIQALQDGYPLTDVLGLTWRHRGTTIENPERPLIENLDELPIPAFDAFDMFSDAPLYLDVGRGCPFQCHFCATAPFWKRTYRMKSIDRIVDEMTFVRDRFGRHQVNFSHDVFTCDRKWVNLFCDRLIENSLDITWTCSTRTDLIDPDLLAKMAEAGCESIYYGIESGSVLIQKQIRKNLDLNWSREVVRATAAVGIRPVTGFIVGYPMETYQTLGDTLDRFFDFLKVGGFRAHLFTLCPFHESPMYREYGHTVNRLAEYYDLPLTLSAQALGDRMKQAHTDIFSSIYRYATPELPEKFIDATEDLSAHLVVLKAIWPLLLPHYLSPLDWYLRWVNWIEIDNAAHRSGNMKSHQGDASDLLRFLDEELKRLGLADSEIADLVLYERLKLEARQSLQAPSSHWQRPVDGNLRVDTVVKKRCEYLAAPLRYDLRSLLSGTHSEPGGAEGVRWVIVAKTIGDEITSIQIGDVAKKMLEAAEDPHPVGDLIASVLPTPIVLDASEVQARVQLVQALINSGLLSEADDHEYRIRCT